MDLEELNRMETVNALGQTEFVLKKLLLAVADQDSVSSKLVRKEVKQALSYCRNAKRGLKKKRAKPVASVE